MGNTQSIRDLIKERDVAYGRAWLESGKVLATAVHTGWINLDNIVRSGYSHAWFTIWNKLFRILHDPSHLDSWRDIAGYAQLVVDKLEAERNAGTTPHVVYQGSSIAKKEHMDPLQPDGSKPIDIRDSWAEGA